MEPPADREPDPDRSNPWKTVSTRSIYENPWIAVREDQVLRPDGLPGIYGVVHFKNRAVGVLPVDDLGGIWLVGQYRYPLNAYSWEIPEGGSPEWEPPEVTARRELREETGLAAGRLELLATAHLSNSVSDEFGYVFRATELTEGAFDPEGTERIVVRRFDWDEAWAMLKRGEITDSLSVIALLHEAVRRLEEARSD
jgi:8-oxo-dGTP pyrophosphatase MutT (NUDIX family)